LGLVYGAFLTLVGITAGAQASMVSSHFTAVSLQAIVGSDAATVRGFVDDAVRADDLGPVGLSDSRLATLEEGLARLVARDGILRAELRRPDGTIVAANLPGLAGQRPSTGPEFTAAATTGSAAAAILDSADGGAGPGDLGSPTVLRELLPVSAPGGEVLAVVGIWRDAVPILARLDAVRADIVTLTVTAAIAASIVLFLIFRGAQARLSRQAQELVAAASRDPLTGLPNHGTLVSELAERIEQARAAGSRFAIAIVDIDNFRLLNDNHGHDAGDFALQVVADILRHTAPADAVVGRYGPDEFVIIMSTSASDDRSAQALVESGQASLVEWGLQFADTEQLPLTVSAAVGAFPDDGGSVTVLLATIAATLGEAKASGGDTIRVVARGSAARSERISSFDVLQALVFSVDTKDRYTKRHSEDVARYGVFLARRLGHDDGMCATIRTAGLLHDVGKIGVPDDILRKPGRLTAEEYEIVKHHVALGDMIVRDLPNADLVRAAVRNHHERWDGSGYLDHLSGEDIPYIARVLAVGDAFSAMTTTRPYRKAVPVREALRRLGDAAGTQLDERLVSVFIDGIENAKDAPMPGDGRPVALWTPQAVA
jgi:diguanylate cyclase (GGDEF)-like protein